MEDKLIEGLAYALPALVTGGVAYFIFSGFLKQSENDKKFAALVEKKKESLPIKLQAYERMLLFCERLNPAKLLVRVKPISTEANDYLQLLLANIEQEFEHNMVQQIYISDTSWTTIIAAKAAIINKLKNVSENSKNAQELRENVLIEYSNTVPPTETAVEFIKSEVKKLL
ncbi:hypothetical protein OD91_0306 [Lutibacter sp. Hel_I_33_5]|uniref:DUF7935 family protein n=1 Tax=Lutibacter sp. Hel_I_33_5 TaxID=1566289 RepID=UPI00119F6DC9|nr:hypothetical protein [Lutibacter sp. Hel_I_33_5]TVZ55064.1 hypothetical protein OD91_0306 [Lutibacter sp. Hel_I_33_5]